MVGRAHLMQLVAHRLYSCPVVDTQTASAPDGPDVPAAFLKDIEDAVKRHAQFGGYYAWGPQLGNVFHVASFIEGYRSRFPTKTTENKGKTRRERLQTPAGFRVCVPESCRTCRDR